MSFKPQGQAGNTTIASKVDYGAINKAVRGGSRPARISLIVDLGVQQRPDFEEEYDANKPKHIKALAEQGATVVEDGGKQVIKIPQSPNPQIAVFGDLTHDVVNYGEDIGQKPYRFMLNKSYMGELHGIVFNGCYSFDKNGQILKDKGFTFHSGSPLTKLAKATKQIQIISGSGKDNMDVSQLLGQAFMAQMDKQERGDNIYINYKGCAEVPMVSTDPTDPDAEEILMPVKELPDAPKCITFDNVTPDDVKFLWGNVIKKIRQADNFEGSKMQEVLDGQQNQQQAKPEPIAPKKIEEQKAPDPEPQKTITTDLEDGWADEEDLPF